MKDYMLKVLVQWPKSHFEIRYWVLEGKLTFDNMANERPIPTHTTNHKYSRGSEVVGY